MVIRERDLQTELKKVANGRKSKFSAGTLAAIVLMVGYAADREPKRKSPREDLRFLEHLFSLEDARN